MTETLQAEIDDLKRRLDAVLTENDSLRRRRGSSGSIPSMKRVSSEVEAGRGITSDVLVCHADPVLRSGGDNKKILYIVRHAEAEHNVWEARLAAEAKAAGKDEHAQNTAAKAVLPDEQFRDARLSNKGQDQVKSSCESFGELITHTHYPMPETVFVSPLRRTLMTASIMFSDHGDIRAMELIRERRTGFPCDERQAARITSAAFPHIDFTDIELLDEESDECYVFRKDLQEVYSDVARRGDKLLPFIKDMDEDVIAIVSHKGFIRELLQDSWKDILSNPENLSAQLSNAEVRVCEITWDGDQPCVVARSLKTTISEPSVQVRHAFRPNKRTVTRSASSFPGGFRAGIATSDLEDDDDAIEDVWREVQERLGGPPTVALLFGNCSINAKAIAANLRRKQPSLSLVGGSSMRGVVTATRTARLGIMGFDGWAVRCAVGHVAGGEICDAASAREAGVRAATQATHGQMPDLIILCASAGHEEDILSGINKVCKGVRVFGGTSGDNALIDDMTGRPWQLYGSLAGWGAITGGVVLLAVWNSESCSMHSVLSHCYGVTGHTGVVTRASGRNIYEIDGRVASDVISQWTGMSLPWSHRKVAEYALAFDGCLVDFKGTGQFGELQCFASLASDLGSHSVQLVHIKPSAVIGAIREVARTARATVRFEIKIALVVICASTGSLVDSGDMKKIEAVLREVAPEVMAVFSCGEQGNAHSGSDAFHGNNMLNFLFVG